MVPQVRSTTLSELGWPAGLRDPFVCASPVAGFPWYSIVQVEPRPSCLQGKLSCLPGAALSYGLNVHLWVHSGVEHMGCVTGHSNVLFNEIRVHFCWPLSKCLVCNFTVEFWEFSKYYKYESLLDMWFENITLGL